MPRKLSKTQADAFSGAEWVSLGDAVIAFAPPRLQKKARAARKKPWPTLSEEFTAAPSFLGLNSHFSDLLGGISARNEPVWQMQEHLLEKLRSGILEADGVRVPVAVAASIEHIPAHFFDERPKVNWYRNTLKNYGAEFHRVRVRLRPAGNSQVQTSQPTKNPHGRPSKYVEVERAIDHAIAEGHNLQTMPRKLAIAQIHVSAAQIGCNTKSGFSVSVVQRALLDRFGKRT